MHKVAKATNLRQKIVFKKYKDRLESLSLLCLEPVVAPHSPRGKARALLMKAFEAS